MFLMGEFGLIFVGSLRRGVDPPRWRRDTGVKKGWEGWEGSGSIWQTALVTRCLGTQSLMMVTPSRLSRPRADDSK